MINLKIDPEFQSQIPPLTDDEYKQLEENILKEGKLISPLIVWNNTLVDTTVMRFFRSTRRFISLPCRSDLRTAKKPLRGFAGISWDGET